MLLVAGAAMALVSLFVGYIIGFVFGAKFAHLVLEREGRLLPRTPPAVVRR